MKVENEVLVRESEVMVEADLSVLLIVSDLNVSTECLEFSLRYCDVSPADDISVCANVDLNVC